MKLPNMRYAEGTVKKEQSWFAGLNRSLGANSGEIWDMQNMVSDHFPVLASRNPRKLYKKLEKPGGIFSWGKLCWVDNGRLYYDDIAEDLLLPDGLEGFDGNRLRFCGINNYLIFWDEVLWPQLRYYQKGQDKVGTLAAGVYLAAQGMTFGNGKLFGEEAKANMLQADGVTWAQYFRPGDAVTISGCSKHPENNKTAIIREVQGDKLYFSEYCFALEDGEAYSELLGKVERKLPDMRWVCENENRLWGSEGNMLYASKLGDPFNWYVYEGINTDSWSVESGDPGEFLGCASYKSFAVFFKDDRTVKIYGSYPTNFQAVESDNIGMEKGSVASVAMVGDTLFYLSDNGVMAYTGGVAQNISAPLGHEKFRNGVAGTDGKKYYISMQGQDGKYRLYVFDTEKGTWHIEDEMQVTHFARCGGALYALNTKGEIWILNDPPQIPEGCTEEETVDWMVELGDITEGESAKKEVARLQIRLELEEDASIEVYMQFDSDGIWRNVKSVIADGPKRSYVLPIVPRRCDHYRIRLQGTGQCRIYSLNREYSVGSALKSKPGRN